MSKEKIKSAVKEFILNEFLPGENPDNLKDSTGLISDGILDSMATLKLIMFLEESYDIQMEPNEMGPEHLNSIETIANLVHQKKL